MIADIRAAFSFLTILPLGSPAGRRRGWSFAWFPLVGLCIGALLVGVAAHSPFDRELSAFLILLVWVLISGGLHLDGFGDSCDGLLAAVEPAERRRIMRDPRAGMWALAGTVLLLLGKWLAIRAVPAEMLILAPVLGRWALVLAAYAFPERKRRGHGRNLPRRFGAPACARGSGLGLSPAHTGRVAGAGAGQLRLHGRLRLVGSAAAGRRAHGRCLRRHLRADRAAQPAGAGGALWLSG